MKFLLSLFSMSLLLAAPVHAQTNPDAEVIKDNIIAMWAAVEKGDLDSYMSYVHEDYTVFGESDTYLQSGKAHERASYDDYLKRYRNIRTLMHQPDIHVRGDTAWVTYYWTDSGYSKAGERFTSRGKSTRIFVKEDGKWLCIHGHFTAVE